MRSLVPVLTLLLAAAPVAAQNPPAPTPPTAPASARAPAAPCTETARRQFDFWLGEWQVTDKTGKVVGHSRIEAILHGCVIAEHWSSGSGGVNDGKSFNIYNAELGHWEQFWVDAQGGRLFLSGGLVAGSMVLSGAHPKPADAPARRERITWTAHADGSVRQLWESSADDGKTWTVAFDGLYRHPASPP